MESLHYLLMKTHTTLHRVLVNQAASLGLSSGQPKILEYLLKYGESNQKNIASYCEIEQTTVGSILLRMEKAGLIVRKQHDGNRRSLFVSLTDKGNKIAEDMKLMFTKTDDEAAKYLSENEQEQLRVLLEKVQLSVMELEDNKKEGIVNGNK